MTFHAHEPKRKRSSEEERLQRTIMQHFRFLHEPGVMLFHIPNGEARSKATGARLKAMGVMAGAPDLIAVLPGGRCAFMEVKSLSGRQSKEQRAFQDVCAAGQTPYAIVRTLDEALETLRRWGVIKPEARAA